MVAGATAREHLTAIWKQSGVKPAELDNECPAIFESVWADFIVLSGKRTSSGFGANPLLHSEIESWCRLTGTSLTAFEIELIDRLDRKYLEHSAKQSEK